MPLEGLAATLIVPGRDDEGSRYTQDVTVRNPGADVTEGSQPYIDGQILADMTAPQYANAVTIANDASRQTRTGAQLDEDGVELGVPRNPAVGASGAVIVSTGPTGSTALAGDTLTINGFQYQVTQTLFVTDGQIVPVTGVSTGPGTDQAAGAAGTWTANRPGMNAGVVVYEQADGTGLSGGDDIESDADYRIRLDEAAANPAASGNDAQYQQLTTKTPTVAVQQAFTFPGIMGPGSTCVLFTLRPNQPGANRIPSAAQILAAQSWVTGQMPIDDQAYWGTITPNYVNVNLQIAWAQGAEDWVDAQPWPPYVGSGGEIAVNGSFPATPTSFYLTGNNGSNAAPVPGQTIGMLDLPNLTFRPKKILTVTVSGTNWIITVDASSGASDTSYTPYAGQIVGPWSASLQSIVTAVVSYFDTLGPGEQLADSDFVDPGLRQRRSPPDPASWPSTLTNRILLPIFAVTTVEDVELLDPTIPYDCPVGSPGVYSYMSKLLNLACFPESS
jgi:uncharacterized phage protein gp47/JayE